MGRYAELPAGTTTSLRRRVANRIGRRLWLRRLARSAPRKTGNGPVISSEGSRIVVRPLHGWRSRRWMPPLFSARSEDEVYAWVAERYAIFG